MKSIVTMASLSVAQTACNAVIALLATVAVGAAGRGVMVVGITLGSFLSFAVGLGTGPALRSRYPSSSEADRVPLVSAYTFWTLTGAVVAPVLATAAAGASAGVIDEGLGETSFLLGLATYTASQFLMNQFVERWYADGHFARAVGSAAAMGLTSLVAVLLCLTFERTPAGLLMAQGLGALAACALVAAKLRAAGMLTLRGARRRHLTALVRTGTPALGVNVGLAIVLRADRYLLGVIAGPAAVGVYSLAATLSEIPRVLPNAAGQVLFRDISTARAAPGAGRLLRSTVLMTVGVGLVGGVLAWFLIPPVFGPEFLDARGLLVVLLVAEVCFAPYALASRGLLGGGWTVAAGSLGMAGAALGVAGYAVATNVAGAAGAAIASVVVYSTLSAAAWACLRNRLATTVPASEHPAGTDARGGSGPGARAPGHLPAARGGEPVVQHEDARGRAEEGAASWPTRT
jgi:O-antigen/teichoic acid export membrane protein